MSIHDVFSQRVRISNFRSLREVDLSLRETCMISIRVWNLESDQDANAVKYLKDGLQESTQRGQLAIQTTGRNAFHKCHNMGTPAPQSLKQAIQHFLKQDDCIVFVTDTAKPKSKTVG